MPDYPAHMLPGMLLTGTGVGLTLPTLVSAAVSAVPPNRFATGSGIVTMARQVGIVLGVAILVTVLGSHAAGEDALPAFQRATVVLAPPRSPPAWPHCCWSGRSGGGRGGPGAAAGRRLLVLLPERIGQAPHRRLARPGGYLARQGGPGGEVAGAVRPTRLGQAHQQRRDSRGDP